ncbi:MAG: tRNA epoxyqueuosine(34) reductase QueG [Chloroflexi bacterium]|nr:tRNA epoxyqueuosine(34) reductase QueG [Chloroflexota bacterium]
MNDLTTTLKQKAMELGFSMVGVVPAVPGRRLDAYLGWVAQEYHGLMGYLARPDRLARRRDLNVILPGVQSLVCVGLDYHTMRIPDAVANDPSRGRISNYAWGVDYHDVMTPKLKELGAWLATQVSGDVANRVYVDTGAIMERDHAESAGFGFVGKNTMLIGPQRGSWFFLGELLTTAPLTFDMPQTMPGCGRCTSCQDACPTNAFSAPYVLDARRCISYLTIELKGWIPREYRPLIGKWVYGCDVCQDVCPFNRFAPQTAVSAFEADSWDSAAPPLLELLTLDEAGFKARFANSPIKRIRRRRLVRNACVAAGNWGSETAVPALTNLLTDAEPLIRGHAAWALHQIGDGVGLTAVSDALADELDKDVQREMLDLAA